MKYYKYAFRVFQRFDRELGLAEKKMKATEPWTEEQVTAYLTRFHNAAVCAQVKPVGKFRRWTNQEILILKAYYRDTKSDDFKLADIAAKLKRSRGAVWRKAGRLKITDQKRKCRSDDWQRRSDTIKKWRKLNPDHKPFGGLKHTIESKDLIAADSRRRWQDPKSFHNQPEYRQWLSDRFSKTAGLRRNYTRGAGGQRSDLANRYFRSSWEANYARYLNLLQHNKAIFRWEYESDTFWFEEIKRGTRSYTPDFKVWVTKDSEPHYEEVKGWFDTKSKTKMARMRRYYPNIKIILIDQKAYSSIARSVARLIPQWERKKSRLTLPDD